VLGDALYTAPTTAISTAVSGAKDISGITFTPVAGAGAMLAGDYYYKFTLADGDPGGPIPFDGSPSGNMTTAVHIAANNGAVNVSGFGSLLNPAGNLDNYRQINIYRTDGTTDAGGDYNFLGHVTLAQAQQTIPGPYVYADAAQTGTTLMNENILTGQYQYYVAFGKSGGDPSRPLQTLPFTVNNGRVHITNLPSAGANPNGWDSWIIYRNAPSTQAGSSRFFQVGSPIPFSTPTPYFTDSTPDSTLYTNDTTHTVEINLDGPKMQKSTLLSNVLQRSGSDYTNLFPTTGILQFVGHKAGGDLSPKNLTLSATTTVGDLTTFMGESLGIQLSDSTTGIPESQDTVHITVPPTMIPPGADVVNGTIRITGNNGVANAIDVTSLGIVVSSTNTNPINLTFNKYQDAIGQSTTTSTQVYDSLGIACNVQLTAVLESSDKTATTYRWFADSQDNQLASGAPDIAVGTGLIKFDGNGNFIGSTQDQVNIFRNNVASKSPLQFKLDFSSLSGLAVPTSSLQVSRQDGSAPGTLTSYIVGEDGLVSGVFSNGVTRDLAQIRLARFGNPAGLQQLGQNLFASGVNSGLPVQGNPGEQGIGSIVSGAVELSNADVGGNLIDLILASTMYRSNTKVISTVQTMLETLLQLQR
jgi:flagellar hook protein FlgE